MWDVRRGVTRYDGGWGLTMVVNFGMMMRINVNSGLLSGWHERKVTRWHRLDNCGCPSNTMFSGSISELGTHWFKEDKTSGK